MNRYKLLAVSFALVLIGTLAIQAYWVSSVIAAKNKQFDDAVFTALQATVDLLEQRENVTFIQHFESDSLFAAKLPHQVEEDIRIITKSSASHRNHQVEFKLDTDSMIHEIHGQKEVKALHKTIVLSSDTMMKVKLRKGNELAALDSKLSKINVLIHKLATNESDFLLKIPAGEEVEKMMASMLRKSNMDLAFFLGIKLNDELRYKSKAADSTAVFTSPYHTEIFPNDVLNRDGELYVAFPGKQAYIFSNIHWLLCVLLVFTILLIYMFYATLSNYKKQKKLNAIKSDFINNMTHELKTPLATIQVASDIILKQSGDPENQVYQMARAIKEQGKRMDEDVKNMLQAALLDHAGKMELHISVFTLRELLEEVRRTFALLAGQKQLELILSCDENLQLEADRGLLGKALNNLLDNAIKYSPENGRIRVEAENRGEAIEISVTDEGSGIAKADQPYVFDRFYRAGKGNVHYNKGYGLGLSFVKQITELHNGRVELSSEAGKGTIIRLLIPGKHG